MGAIPATQKLKHMRVYLNEPLDDGLLDNPNAGTLYTNATLLVHLNNGKNRLWDLIRRVKKDFFQQSGDTSLALSSSTRRYTLPVTFRELVYLKVTTPGYEFVRFQKLDQQSEAWKLLLADPDSHTTTGILYYDIVGNEEIIFANFPPRTLETEMGYIKWIADYTLSASSTSDIRDEWSEFEEKYGAREALLGNPKDERIGPLDARLKELAEDIPASVAPRQVRDPEFIDAF